MPEVRGGHWEFNGGWVQAFCQYCGWASNAMTIDEACADNEAHERTHPEFTEPEPLESLVDRRVP